MRWLWLATIIMDAILIPMAVLAIRRNLRGRG